MKASEIAVDLDVPSGANVVVLLQPGADIGEAAGKLGGRTLTIPCVLADGTLARLRGGSRLWAVVAPHQRRADSTGKPVKVKVGKEGEGTATRWTCVVA